MAQTFVRIAVDGFHADEFDFAAALQRKPVDKAAFDDFVSQLVVAEAEPDNGVFWSVAIIGHADRVDVPGLSIEERRALELEASRQRMESAANHLFFTEFANGLTDSGLTPPTSFDDATNVGLCFIRAGAADLVHPTPAAEAERQANRRVKFLAICFSPQPLALTFGEQLDRVIA
jgi:hypothetical protein